MRMKFLIVICLWWSWGVGGLQAAEFNPYVHQEHDEINFRVFRLASESMGAFMDAMKQYITYTTFWPMPGAVESGVGYFYDNKTKRMKRNLFYRIKDTEVGIETNRPLDFQCEGKGFFVIQLPGGFPAFTKDGRFELDQDDRLVTMSEGFPVLGENGPIHLPSDDVQVDPQGTITHQGEVIDVFRIEWFKNLHDLDSFNHVVFFLNKEDYESGDKHAPTDYRIAQGRVQQSTIEKEHLGRVVEWKNSHEAQTILLKAYSKNLRASIQQLGFQ